MKSLYNNLLKSGNIVKNEETRVIDSNSKIAERLKYLQEILGNQESEDDFYEGFTAGLDAIKVEQLLDDDGNLEPIQDVQEPSDLVNTAYDHEIEEANAEAEAILSAAREEADRLVAEANAEAQSIREQAMADGHGEGYKAGYDEGLRIAEEAEEKFRVKEAEMEVSYNQKLDELEPLFIEKLTGIYEHLFMVDLSDRQDLIMHLLVNCIRNIEGGKTFLVHVSKEDYEYVNSNKDELTKGLPGTSTLEVIEDISLSQAQCFIEADSGIYDCGLGTELSLLKKELALLSYRQ